jgi:hypothetical protein
MFAFLIICALPLEAYPNRDVCYAESFLDTIADDVPLYTNTREGVYSQVMLTIACLHVLQQ